MVGCGNSELVCAIYGLELINEGVIRDGGEVVHHPSAATPLGPGLCYFPSDRVTDGLVLGRPIRENVSMTALDLPTHSRRGVLQRGSERRAIQSIVGRLKLPPPQFERTVTNLSAGNRQKVPLERGLTREINVDVFAEPTVGIDVSAKTEVYNLMREVVATSAAIVLVSSDLPEAPHLLHGLYVMRRSRMAAELIGADINEPEVLAHFFCDDAQYAPSSRNAERRP